MTQFIPDTGWRNPRPTGPGSPKQYACMGYWWLDLYVEVKTNPRNPKLRDWYVDACQWSETHCEGLKCETGPSIAATYNAPYNKLTSANLGDNPRVHFPVSPTPFDWPFPATDGPPSHVVYHKMFWLGCCADECGDGPTFMTSRDNVVEFCYKLSGTVDPSRLIDPVLYYSYNSDAPDPGFSRVGCHAALRAINDALLPNGKHPPKFTPCCGDPGALGGGSSSGGGSNG